MNIDDSVNMDELVVGGLEPRTWYHLVQAQINLLCMHVHGLEKQIDESVKAYEKEKVATYVEHEDDGYSHTLAA
jgi:hypothetical protein